MSSLAKKKRFYLDIIPGAAAAQLFKTIAFMGFNGWVVAGVSAALGCAVGFALCHYVRMKITKNWDSGLILSLSISIGIALPFILATVLLSDNSAPQSADTTVQQKAIDWEKGVMTYPPVNQKP